MSPWTHLVNGTATTVESSDPQALETFQATAGRLAEEERSIRLPPGTTAFNLLAEFPLLQDKDVFKYVQEYASLAPYPILHWINVRENLEQLLHTHHAWRWGQIACILMVRNIQKQEIG